MQLLSVSTTGNVPLVRFGQSCVDDERYNTLLPNKKRNLTTCSMRRGPETPKNSAPQIWFEIRSDVCLWRTLHRQNWLPSWNSPACCPPLQAANRPASPPSCDEPDPCHRPVPSPPEMRRFVPSQPVPKPRRPAHVPHVGSSGLDAGEGMQSADGCCVGGRLCCGRTPGHQHDSARGCMSRLATVVAQHHRRRAACAVWAELCG